MAQKLKPKVLAVVCMVCYMPKINHIDFRCGMGCYTLCCYSPDDCISFVIDLLYLCSCLEDLAVYVKALDDCLLRIPPNSLSKV